MGPSIYFGHYKIKCTQVAKLHWKLGTIFKVIILHTDAIEHDLKRRAVSNIEMYCSLHNDDHHWSLNSNMHERRCLSCKEA